MQRFKVLIPLIRQFKEKHLNRNIITYLICVVIASILWFLNALSKEYSAEITYPVKYTNFPAGHYPIADLPTQFRLQVKAKGFALLRYRIQTSFLPITFNVGSYCQNKNLAAFTLQTNELKDKISSQLNNEIQLQNVFPEEITFKFSEAEKKKVAVLPVVHYTLKRQYIINTIQAQPDSVWIEGPANILDTLQGIPTTEIQLKNISKNTTKTADLVSLPYCQTTENTIKVEVRVEQFTEAHKTIPLQTLQVPDSLALRLFPDNINISYEVGLSKYDKITAEDFLFAVDYPQQTNEAYLEIKAVKVPAFIKNLSFTPQKVEYIIEKK